MLVYRKCARLVLGIEYQQEADDDDVPLRTDFKRTVTESVVKLQHFRICHVFLVLDRLIQLGWTDSTLSALMTADTVDEVTGSNLIH